MSSFGGAGVAFNESTLLPTVDCDNNTLVTVVEVSIGKTLVIDDESLMIVVGYGIVCDSLVVNITILVILVEVIIELIDGNSLVISVDCDSLVIIVDGVS